MGLVIESFWRAATYILLPRVVVLSFLPLLFMLLLSAGLSYFFWDVAVSWMSGWLHTHALRDTALDWLDFLGSPSFRVVFAQILVLVLCAPLIVLLCLLLVSLFMTSAVVELVARRRFALLERKQGGSFLLGLIWSAGSTLLALLALVVSMPVWLIPPLVFFVPPLVWGWLTYRVFTFDALAIHASAAERKALMQEHRSRLLLIGVLSGYLGAAPSVLWASSALFIAFAPLLIPLAIWIYTWVFAFASLWFAHFSLSALQALRARMQNADIANPSLLASADHELGEPFRAPRLPNPPTR